MSNPRVAKIIRKFARTTESRNIQHYQEFVNDGYNYILNPKSKELHHVNLSDFFASHDNLRFANLEEFWGIYNLDDDSPIHDCKDGTEIPLYCHETNEFIENYTLNKCKHCFPA